MSGTKILTEVLMAHNANVRWRPKVRSVRKMGPWDYRVNGCLGLFPNDSHSLAAFLHYFPLLIQPWFPLLLMVSFCERVWYIAHNQPFQSRMSDWSCSVNGPSTLHHSLSILVIEQLIRVLVWSLEGLLWANSLKGDSIRRLYQKPRLQ